MYSSSVAVPPRIPAFIYLDYLKQVSRLRGKYPSVPLFTSNPVAHGVDALAQLPRGCRKLCGGSSGEYLSGKETKSSPSRAIRLEGIRKEGQVESMMSRWLDKANCSGIDDTPQQDLMTVASSSQTHATIRHSQPITDRAISSPDTSPKLPPQAAPRGCEQRSQPRFLLDFQWPGAADKNTAVSLYVDGVTCL